MSHVSVIAMFNKKALTLNYLFLSLLLFCCVFFFAKTSLLLSSSFFFSLYLYLRVCIVI